MPKRRFCRSRFLLILLSSLLFVGLLLAPSVALAKFKKNASLVHVGPSGLESYNAWTKKSSTVVSGMVGTWYYPVFSPNGISVVTMKNNRSDRAYSSEIYGAVVSSTTPFELTYDWPEGGIGMTSFLGWLDDYQAVFQQDDPNNPDADSQVMIVRDVRDSSSGSYYSGSVTYPSNGRKSTAWDRACSVWVSRKGVMKITRRKGKRVLAQFKLPGFGGGKKIHGWNTGWEYWADASISPDGKFIAYSLASQPKVGDSFVSWRTYVCTLTGKSSRRIKNNNGGFVWK